MLKPKVVTLGDVEDSKIRSELRRLGKDADALAAEMTRLANKRKEKVDRMEKLVKSLRVSKLTGDGWVFEKCKGGRSDISPEILLSRGVKMATIKAATVVKRWVYYRLSSVQGE